MSLNDGTAGTALPRRLLLRGMAAGIVAGVVAFAVARLLGDSSVAAAIALEGTAPAAVPEAAGHAHEESLTITRAVQTGVGLLSATVLYAVGVGGMFALAFAAMLGRLSGLGRLPARALAAVLAMGAFVTVSLVPFLKYPPNPPAVGDGSTIVRRSTLYLIVIVVSVLVAALAVLAWRALAPRWGGWNAGVLAGVGYLVALAVVFVVLPGIDEVPANFPAATLYEFRWASLGVQASVWATLGLTFGVLAERLLVPAESVRSHPVPV